MPDNRKEKKIKSHALILAGGVGTRLWPISRRNCPKQFLCLASETPLLDQTIKRISPLFPKERIWLVTKPCHRDRISRNRSILKENIIIEPVPKGTAAAICLGAAFIEAKHGKSLITVMPSDHFIDDEGKFREIVEIGVTRAFNNSEFVMYGIKHSRPETAYGYIESGKFAGIIKDRKFHYIKKFHEKPEKNTASTYCRSENFMWNSGIFTFFTTTFLELLRLYRPDMFKITLELEVSFNKNNEGQKKIYSQFNNLSIDRALLENIKLEKLNPITSNQDETSSVPGVSVTECDFKWHDLGIWETFFSLSGMDGAGNVVFGKNIEFDCSDTLLLSEDENTLVAAIGLENIVVVAGKNSVLVCSREKINEVGRIVDFLEKKGMKEYI